MSEALILGDMECPDCGSKAVDRYLKHLDGCPVGDGYAAIQQNDREFFDKYPNIDERRRKPVWAELIDLLIVSGKTLPPNPFGKSWTPGGCVKVIRGDVDWIRFKDYSEVYFMADKDHKGPVVIFDL